MDALIEFLNTKRVCVVSVLSDENIPLSAAVHFAYMHDSLTFIIQTSPEYRKAQPLLTGSEIAASIVVGIDEYTDGKDMTFQLNGTARMVDTDSVFAQHYLSTFPEKKGKWEDDVFFIVEPTWWRFTQWGTEDGMRVTSSED